MANNEPFKVNISELSSKLGTSRNVLTRYLVLLNKAGLINILSTEGIGYTMFRKPDKIYLSNTNIIYAISTNVIIGNVRETFFINQVSQLRYISYPKSGDFLVDNKYIFEIGGKNKSNKQIINLRNSFLAIDDIEFGYNNKIPLWLFGFLY